MWPRDTRLLLVDVQTDLYMEEEIFIGQVPPGAQVKIKISIDAHKSSLVRHSFAYMLCHGSDPVEQIGTRIKLAFRVAHPSEQEEQKGPSDNSQLKAPSADEQVGESTKYGSKLGSRQGNSILERPPVNNEDLDLPPKIQS